MNNGLKALLIAASTIITCIIVGLGFTMAREAKQIGNHVVEELHQYRNGVEERDLMKYDKVVVYGSDVINLMKKELSETENGFRVTVCEGEKKYSYKNSVEADKTQNAESVEYIHPTSQYTGEVVRNKNEVIVEIVFTRNGS